MQSTRFSCKILTWIFSKDLESATTARLRTAILNHAVTILKLYRLYCTNWLGLTFVILKKKNLHYRIDKYKFSRLHDVNCSDCGFLRLDKLDIDVSEKAYCLQIGSRRDRSKELHSTVTLAVGMHLQQQRVSKFGILWSATFRNYEIRF